MINWNVSPQDIPLITSIVKKALDSDPELIIDHDFLSLEMDITACHLNGTPLDLEKFLNFDEPNFGHDFYGIVRYINRSTGELTNNFLPRCAK